MLSPPFKRCKTCKIDKSLEDFYDCPTAADGKRGTCKDCICERRRRSYAADAERYKDDVKEWRTKNPNRVKEYERRYRQRNKRKSRERVRQWRKDNPEKWKEQQRRALAKQKEEGWPNAYRRRAREMGAFVEDVNKVDVFINSLGFCGICGFEVKFEKMTIDHIVPLARGGLHCYANVQAAHAFCNRVKGSKLQEELTDEDFSKAVAAPRGCKGYRNKTGARAA